MVFNLYLFHWDSTRSLLFVHTSDNDASHEIVAKAVAGNDVELVKGTEVFRVFSGIKRLLLQTLGLTHAIGRLIRFTMLVGADIHSGLAEGQTQTKVKTNVFASGYHAGKMISIGCSRRGRVWSRRAADSVLDWVRWCNELSVKLQDVEFSEEDILSNSIVPEDIVSRPSLIPLVIEWPTSFYEKNEISVYVHLGAAKHVLYKVGIDLTTFDDVSPICFAFILTRNRAFMR